MPPIRKICNAQSRSANANSDDSTSNVGRSKFNKQQSDTCQIDLSINSFNNEVSSEVWSNISPINQSNLKPANLSIGREWLGLKDVIKEEKQEKTVRAKEQNLPLEKISIFDFPKIINNSRSRTFKQITIPFSEKPPKPCKI